MYSWWYSVAKTKKVTRCLGSWFGRPHAAVLLLFMHEMSFTTVIQGFKVFRWRYRAV